MNMRLGILGLAMVLAASGVTWAGPPSFVDRSADYSVGYEFTKVRRSMETSRTWTSGIHAVGYRVRAARELYLTGQFCYWAEEWTDGQDPDDLTGNPYLGVEVATRDNLWFNLGLNLPAASEGAASIRPLVADPMRAEHFAPDFLTFTAQVHSGHVGGRTRFIWTLDLAYAIPTGDKSGNLPYLHGVERASEALVGYGIEAETGNDLFRLWMRFHGRFAMTERGESDDRSTHQLAAGIVLTRHSIRPGFHLTVPLDQLVYQYVNYTASFTLTTAWGD